MERDSAEVARAEKERKREGGPGDRLSETPLEEGNKDEQNQGDEPVMDPDPVSEENNDEGDGPSVADAFRSG
jgi:hypothetical protein